MRNAFNFQAELTGEVLDFDDEHDEDRHETCSFKETSKKCADDGSLRGGVPMKNGPTRHSDEEEWTGPIKKRARLSRKPWNKDEENAVKTHFRANFVMNKLPGKAEIEQAIAEKPALKHRSWKNIKDYIRNKLKKITH